MISNSSMYPPSHAKCDHEPSLLQVPAETQKRKVQSFNIRTEFKAMHDMAELRVGAEAVRFVIHRNILTHHSTFFRAALNGAFAEGLSQTVTLPTESLDTFELFLHWAYTCTLDPKAYFKDAKPAYYVLLHLYGLADRLAVEGLRNLVLDTISSLADQTNSVLTPSDTFILYDTIPSSAPIRRLVLDLFAFKKTDKLLDEHPDEWHPQFTRDLVVKLKRPEEVAMQRHTLITWKPEHWQESMGCAICSEVLHPYGNHVGCSGCEKKFCNRCAKAKRALCVFEDGRVVCKPWNGKVRCRIYHEHVETAECP
ncbi:hypothetical protein EJ05DRAFT_382875 [Pseudovirgaria hyperparasitica]|uniref:BTB domain-containing protein n=1 Tax=Pseudovirgaria hyperparasitica TaxID=470096 RepID=A0A6A6W6U6_9PEZI|nr:uncharacterized protein EJ05DRAFT_382875 [Pseudovirgaria hyperparasitica]KAF2758265.1 hypothetical protein EJ05DRAFT_382875 [Pseudovirgaria hyperparasitica]